MAYGGPRIMPTRNRGVSKTSWIRRDALAIVYFSNQTKSGNLISQLMSAHLKMFHSHAL